MKILEIMNLMNIINCNLLLKENMNIFEDVIVCTHHTCTRCYVHMHNNFIVRLIMNRLNN